MKTIKLYAYWPKNLGDDLMVHILLKRYPQYHFFADCWDENSVFENYPNFSSMGSTQKQFGRLNHLFNILTFYKKRDFLINSIRQRLNQCECSVYIGGSLYQQGNKVQFEEWLKHEEKKLVQSPLFIIGANFGPYITEEFKDAFAAYYRKCGGITFRDKASYALFADNEKVAYAPDVVFNLEVPENMENNQTVLISVIDTASREDLHKWSDVYEARMAELCEICIGQGKTPVLMSFCKTEGDEAAVQRILNKLSDDKILKTKTFLYDGDIEAALELYRKADRVIATRFHAMILALKFRKPVYSISYNQKVKNVLQDMHMNCYCEMKDLKEASGKAMLDACQTTDVRQYTRQAEMQFTQFEAYMKGVI